MLKWILLAYIVIAALVFVVHATQLQMVSFPLAVLRSLFWPYWLLGGLRGAPISMD